MPEYFFAIGTSLTALQNAEALFGEPPHVLPAQAVPYLRPVRQRTLDGAVQRNGSINVVMQWDVLRQSDLLTAIETLWGDFTTSSKTLYASWWDETNHYAPFSVVLERPLQGEHYQVSDQVWAVQLAIPGYNWTLQSVTKTGDATIATGERLVYGDTSGGNITLTLPAANAPNANTLFSFVKTSASNSLIVQRAGSDTIDGNTSVTLTDNGARLDLYSDGVSAWSSL